MPKPVNNTIAIADFDRLVPKSETLHLLGDISYTTLWHWVRIGKFPPGRYAGGRLCWRQSEIETFIESCKKQGTVKYPGAEARRRRREEAEAAA